MRILTCMSGGVDSSVAAALLQRQGHDVVGLFLRGAGDAAPPPGGAPAGPPVRDGASGPARGDPPGSPERGVAPAASRPPRGCCSAVDALDAARVAATLGIPFYSADFAAGFEGLVEEFVAEYLRGRTPNPCVLCNRDLKFGKAREWAEALGCDAIATGHYARTERIAGRVALRAAEDPAKDQSYVLFPLSQDALARALFPLGGMRKEEVRAEARALGLDVADKPESMDICFVPGGDYRALLRERAGDRLVPGDVVDAGGRALGRHGGAGLFTVGQRRGLPATGRGSPLYVTGVDAGSGTVVVGDAADLLAGAVTVGGWNAVAAPAPGSAPLEGRAKVRRSHEPVPARAFGLPGGGVRVEFHEAVRAPAPGQALVLYDGAGRVLGGGWIESSERAPLRAGE
jgi:tRNA-specific 2-thiouridylase